MIGLTLRQQIAHEAARRGNGWETMGEELGSMAVEIVGSNHPILGNAFKAVCAEVFRCEE